MRHPAAGPLEVRSLAEFVRGLGPVEEATVTAALNENLSCARYGTGSGSIVVSFGGRRAHIPGQAPAQFGGLPPSLP